MLLGVFATRRAPHWQRKKAESIPGNSGLAAGLGEPSTNQRFIVHYLLVAGESLWALAFGVMPVDYRAIPANKANNEGITMSDALNSRPSISFWLVGGAALVWNLIGLMFYYMQVTMTPEALEGFTEPQQAFFSTTPAWATSAYAIAVTAGVLGSLLLLLRQGWAVLLFILSLIGIIVQDFHAFVLSSGLDVFGSQAIVLPTLVIVIAVALVWYSRDAKANGWLS